MSRFEVAEAAVTEKLRALKLKPEMTINLFDLGIPLSAAGFSQEEIIAVLYALDGGVSASPRSSLQGMQART